MKLIKRYEAFVGGEPKSLLPEPAVTELKKIKLSVPTYVQKELDESIFSMYGSIRDIEMELSRQGYDADWLEQDFEDWKDGQAPYFDEDEPEIDDFDNEEDFEAEHQEWEERTNEYEEFMEKDFEDLFDDYVASAGGWGKFADSFQIKEKIADALDKREMKIIYDEMQEDFNKEDLIQYFDEAEEVGATSMQMVGNNFDDESRFWVEVMVKPDITDEEIELIKDYLEGQCSDGWGEGFEQQDIDGWYVSTWWNDEYSDNSRLGDYEIRLEE
ncbi:MAG: hypothetical protein M0R46_11500 [Candidatus Muirbacterium halophilum]|nr:hypothetical protein [Candidatus Muirbacterium halophilum]